MRKDAKIRASYDYLCKMAEEGGDFTLEDLVVQSGWTLENTKTNISKRLREFVIAKSPETYTANRSVLAISYEDDYYPLFVQARKVFKGRNTHQHKEVIVYEFFLPYSHERVLRKRLDELFYRDTLENLIREQHGEDVERNFPRHPAESDDKYMSRLLDFVGDKFGGYSVYQVSGRFRTGPLQDRQQARARDGYVVDETTAVVKFIIPAAESSTVVSDAVSSQLSLHFASDSNEDEIEAIRWLFQRLFVDAVVKVVKEDEIWLLETGRRCRLYRYVDSKKVRAS